MQGKFGFRGEVITLTEGRYAAGVAVVGATLEWLTFEGRDIVFRNPEGRLMRNHSGAVAVPWAHAVYQGNYTFNGEEHQLPLDKWGLALLGLLCFQEYQVSEKSANSVKLTHNLWPQPGYPFTLEITVVYSLDNDTGLEIKVTAQNTGEEAAPYGTSGHPYVIPGPEPMAKWTLTIPHTLVQRRMQEPPKKIETVQESALDMRAGWVIGDFRVDDAFSGLEFDAEGRWRVTVTSPSGTGVEVSAGYWCPWVIVSAHHWADLPEERRWVLSIQPSTSPPHAFRTGSNLIVLKPGDSHTASWRIRGLGGTAGSEVSTKSEDSSEDSPCEAQAINFPAD